MSRNVSDLLGDLDELEVPDLWAEISARNAASNLAIDVGSAVGDELPADARGSDQRGRRLLVAAAALFVLVAAVVAVFAVVLGDEDSSRVITEQPETPATVEIPATTVAPPPSTVATTTPTTTIPTVPEVTLAAFTSPPEYGYPYGSLSCCAAAEDYQFTLLGSPGTADDPFSEGDLLIATFPGGSVPDRGAGGEEHSVRGTTGYSGSWFPDLGFTGGLIWAEAPLGVVAVASRSHTPEELVVMADSLDIEEPGGRFVVPEGFVPIADQGYDAWLGPLSRYSSDLTSSDQLTYRSEWSTGGRGDEEYIYVNTTPASAGVLELVEYLVEDSSRVPVRGTTGVIGTFRGSQQLSWIENDTALVTITATDSTVDLIAMADSDPPEPWSPAPDLTVLSGSDYGVDWNLTVRKERGRDFLVCFDSGGGCQGAGVTWSMPDAKPRDDDGNYLNFAGGRAPACATTVRATPSGESAPTTLGPDGHRYFMLAVPATADRFPSRGLEALDDGGAVVATHKGNDGRAGWPDDIC